MKVTIGIDPGKGGAIAVVTTYNGTDGAYAVDFGEDCIGKTIDEICATYDKKEVFAYLESVHAFPGQGVSSSFTFGQAFGEAKGALDALAIPYKLITPQSWQKGILGLPKKKDGPTAHKRYLKQEAQRRFPQTKPTLKTCDALLIAEYGHRDRG
jgi:crossover junction endodeoxyribonuclease RuvC